MHRIKENFRAETTNSTKSSGNTHQLADELVDLSRSHRIT